LSAFIVNRDTIDLLVTLAVMRRVGTKRPEPPELVTAVVEHADHYGRVLWQANHDAHDHVTGTATPLPRYEWLPVMELIVGEVTGEQLVQIERSRRTLLEQSQSAPGWAGSEARKFLEILGRVIDQGLESWTRVGSADQRDYVGLRFADPHWTRSAGLPVGDLFDDAAS
jgi:hypothetical protein